MAECPFCEHDLQGRMGRWGEICSFCGRLVQKHSYSYLPRRVDPEKVRKLIEKLRHGFTIKTSAKKAEVGYIFAQDYAHRLIDNLGEEIVCGCGQPRSHKGYCLWRIVNDQVWKFMAERRARKALSLPSVIGTMWRPEEEVIHGNPCKEKACPFGAAEGLELCEYHAHFYDYDLSLIDDSVPWENMSRTYDGQDHTMGAMSVVGIRDVVRGARLVMQRARPQSTRVKKDKPKYWQTRPSLIDAIAES